MEGDLSVDNIDTEEMVKYLAVVLEDDEKVARKLTKHLPCRTVESEGRGRGDQLWPTSTAPGTGAGRVTAPPGRKSGCGISG